MMLSLSGRNGQEEIFSNISMSASWIRDARSSLLEKLYHI